MTNLVTNVENQSMIAANSRMRCHLISAITNAMRQHPSNSALVRVCVLC